MCLHLRGFVDGDAQARLCAGEKITGLNGKKAVKYGEILYGGKWLCRAVLCCAALRCAVLYCAALS